MLRKLSEQVRECYERAAEAKAKAQVVADPSVKAGYFDMEDRWLMLARSRAFTESLSDFTAANAAWRQRFDERAREHNPVPFQKRTRDAWLASIVESSYDAIYSSDLGGIITSWSSGAESLYGYSAKEAVGQQITILIPPNRPDEERAIIERIRRGERIAHYETVRRRKQGSLIVVSLTVSPIKNAAGTIVGASRIARDTTTQRKQADERQNMLIAELDHRVKNVLARVAVVASYTRQGSRSMDEFIKVFDGRIQALASAHVLLSQSCWKGVDLADLARHQLAPYAGRANTTVTGPEVILGDALTQAVAMVLHELVTNAAKYGALSGPSGRVSISWSRHQNEGAAESLMLDWHETGGPPILAAIQPGYGTRLIRDLIPHELGGSVDLVFAVESVRCRIEVPLNPA